MSLITTSAEIAAELNSIEKQTVSFLKTMASRSFALVNTPGQEQAVLDAMGSNAIRAVTVYSAVYQALTDVGEADGLDAPDLSVFQPQQDGTVLFVAPPPPVVEPEPEP